jgi:predicted transcriptional regulator
MRRIIFMMIYRKQDEAVGSREIARQLEHPLSSVNYHLRVLAEKELISLARTEPVRGTLRNYYVCPPAVRNDASVREAIGLTDRD